MSALWTAAEIAAAVAGQSCGRLRRRPASRSTAAASSRATCSSRCRGRPSTGTTSSPPRLQRGAAGALIHRRPNDLPAGAPVIEVVDTMKALEDLGRAARGRSNAEVAAVTGSVGKTSTKEALRSVLALFGADLRHHRQPQQPVGRAAQPGAHAARHPLRRVRARHEPCRRDLAAVADGAAARRRHHHGRAGAYRVLRLGGGDRRRQGRDLRRPDARRRRPSCRSTIRISTAWRPRPSAWARGS